MVVITLQILFVRYALFQGIVLIDARTYIIHPFCLKEIMAEEILMVILDQAKVKIVQEDHSMVLAEVLDSISEVLDLTLSITIHQELLVFKDIWCIMITYLVLVLYTIFLFLVHLLLCLLLEMDLMASIPLIPLLQKLQFQPLNLLKIPFSTFIVEPPIISVMIQVSSSIFNFILVMKGCLLVTEMHCSLNTLDQFYLPPLILNLYTLIMSHMYHISLKICLAF